MNLFNRIATMFFLLVVAVVALVVALMPANVLAVLRQYLTALEIAPQDQLYIAIVGIVVVIICGLLLVLEVRRPTLSGVALSKLPEGVAEFATESIGQRLKHDLEALPEVHLVSPKVISRGNAVDVEIVVQTSPEVDIPDKTSEVYQAIRTNMDQMGLKLGKLRVNMRYSPYQTSLSQKTR